MAARHTTRPLVTGLVSEGGWDAVHFASVQWGLVPPDIAPRIEDGLLKTADGRVFSILHQYDRSQALRALVDERLEVTG